MLIHVLKAFNNKKEKEAQTIDRKTYDKIIRFKKIYFIVGITLTLLATSNNSS